MTFAAAALVCAGRWGWRSEQTHARAGRSQHFVALIPSQPSLSQHPTCVWHSGKCHRLLRRPTLLPPELTAVIRRLSIKNHRCTHRLRTHRPRQEACCWWRDRAFYSAPNCPASCGEVTTALSALKQLVHVAETSASPSFPRQPQTNE